MAAYVASTVGGGTSGTGNRTVTVTTAVSGSLLIAFVSLSANATTTPTMTDDHADGLGTWTRIGTALWSASANNSAVFVRNALLGSTDTSFIVTCVSGSNTAGEIVVVEVSGMGRSGFSAVRSSGSQANQALGGTPAPVLSQAALTGNMTLAAVMSGDTTTSPASGWTERNDVSQSTPTTALEVCTRNSGFTGTTVTFGATCSTVYASWAIELDSSASPTAAVVAEASADSPAPVVTAAAEIAAVVAEATAEVPEPRSTIGIVLLDSQPISFSGTRVVEVPRTRILGNLLTLRLARCTNLTSSAWSSTTNFVHVMLAVSRDDGASWEDVGGGGDYGGIHPNPDEDVGGDLPEMRVAFHIDDDVNRIRLTASASEGLSSSLTVEVRQWP